MAKRKLNAFTADDAGDEFIPTVKTIQGAQIEKEKKIAPEKRSVELKAETDTNKEAQEENPLKAVSPKVAPEKKIPVAAKQEKTFETKTVPKPDEKSSPSLKKDFSGSVQERKISPPPQKMKKAVQAQMQGKEVNKEKKGDSLVQLVGFNLLNEEFAIDIKKVQEINRIIEVTPVPRTQEYVEGVINLRGKVIPVIQLRKRLGHAIKEYDSNTRIIIVDVNGKTIGLLVDSVSEVLRIPASTIEPPPEIVTGVDTKYIKGVGKLQDRLIVLLDLEKIIQNNNVEVNDVTV